MNPTNQPEAGKEDSPQKVKRYELYGEYDSHFMMESEDGDYVLFKDYQATRSQLEQARRELEGERNMHGQTRVVVEELNTICNDLKNAGQPQFIRSEAIRLLREEVASLRGQLEVRDSQLSQLQKEVGPLRELVGVDSRAASSLHDINHWKKLMDAWDENVRLRSALTTAKATIAELERDRARLDWLENDCSGLTWNDTCPGVERATDGQEFFGDTLREALDAATQGTKKDGYAS